MIKKFVMKSIMKITYNLFLWLIFGIISTLSAPLILRLIDSL